MQDPDHISSRPPPPPLTSPPPSPPPPPLLDPTPQPRSQPPQMNESPLSPLRSDEPEHRTTPLSSKRGATSSASTVSGGGAIVSVVEKYYSPLASPLPSSPPKPSSTNNHHHNNVLNSSSQIINFIRAGGATTTPSGGGGGRKERKAKVVRFGVVGEIVERSRRVEGLQRVALGFRVCGFVLCLISFSVMASDKTQGWSGDSFDRYKEYRFCLSVNVIGFVYSGFQALALAYHLVTGKHVVAHHLCHQFDFLIDQVLAYLLISASSAAAARVLDWQLNWGKDEFTEKASASVSMSFLAFVAFAISSLISGYKICNHEFT